MRVDLDGCESSRCFSQYPGTLVFQDSGRNAGKLKYRSVDPLKYGVMNCRPIETPGYSNLLMVARGAGFQPASRDHMGRQDACHKARASALQ